MKNTQVKPIGHGIFAWNRDERTSKRYGYFYLNDSNYGHDATTTPWLHDLTPLVGIKVRMTCVVVESRKSGHLGDNAINIRPSQPVLGEVIELGVGILNFRKANFAASTLEVGLHPGDDRDDYWFDPHVLYRLHDQTVNLVIQPTDADFTAAPIIDEAPPGVIANGDGSYQYNRITPRDGDRLLPKVMPLGDGLFEVSHDHQAGDSIEISRELTGDEAVAESMEVLARLQKQWRSEPRRKPR